MKKMKLSAALVVLILCAATLADYIKSDSVDFKSILTTAPSLDSDQMKKELQQVLDLQEKRTPEEVARAKSEETITAFSFSDVLGPSFNPDDLKVTAAVMKEAGDEAKKISGLAKDFYGRKRPFQADERVKPCVAPENTPGYPSGHSTRATVWAIVLGEIFPDKKDALIARANQIGDDRVLGGMHFPSDVAAGRILGAAIARKMLADPGFQVELQQMKDEVEVNARRKRK